MMTLCVECENPQECAIVKGYCPIRLVEAQLEACGQSEAQIKARCAAQIPNDVYAWGL